MLLDNTDPTSLLLFCQCNVCLLSILALSQGKANVMLRKDKKHKLWLQNSRSTSHKLERRQGVDGAQEGSKIIMLELCCAQVLWAGYRQLLQIQPFSVLGQSRLPTKWFLKRWTLNPKHQHWKGKQCFLSQILWVLCAMCYKLSSLVFLVSYMDLNVRKEH